MKSALDERRDLALGRIKEKRAFKISLVIFVSVNALLLVLWAGLSLAGAQVTGQLWLYPVVMGFWALYIAFRGYRAYHEPTYPEERIQREMKNLT